MKERLSEQEKELETLKITMKAKDMELKSDGTETAKAAGECTLYWQSSYPNLKMSLSMRKTKKKKKKSFRSGPTQTGHYNHKSMLQA